jgi:hypothetical protein
MLVADCAMAENGTPSGCNVATIPEPGTREFYEQKIRGVYALDGDVLVRIASRGIQEDPHQGKRRQGAASVHRTHSGRGHPVGEGRFTACSIMRTNIRTF